ncbi:MAG TPA: response regulator [Rhodocyclaceae bacterium]|nr:response regulator [Rhodocyclaceae bacterium]
MPSTFSEPQAAPAVLKLFVVEDSPAISENLIATLAEMLEVEPLGCARDERAAIEWMLAPDARCDLMIIDIFLKAGSGLEVLRRAKVLRPEAKLVVLTNYATPDMRRRCDQLGADRVFDKSAELEQLFSYCESLVEAS